MGDDVEAILLVFAVMIAFVAVAVEEQIPFCCTSLSGQSVSTTWTALTGGQWRTVAATVVAIDRLWKR